MPDTLKLGEKIILTLHDIKNSKKNNIPRIVPYGIKNS